MIGTAVALHDVRDVEGFCAFTIQKSKIRLSREDREELMAEGIVIMAELASKFEYHREGYEQAGTFSGYAGAYLPKRLKDAYHRLHPEHLARRDEDGRRVYEYAKPNRSIFDEDLPELVASAFLGPVPEDHYPVPTVSVASIPYEPPPVISAALARVPAEYGIGARGVVRLIDEGYGTDEIAARMRMNRGDVAGIQAAVGSAIWEVQTLEAA